MTDHISDAETSLETLADSPDLTSGIESDIREDAKIHALIAIAEQLRIANLIALATSDLTLDEVAITALEDTEHTMMQPFETGSLNPDIAEALGIKEEA